MTKAIQSEYYGNDTRWFIGIVEEIADPSHLGRVKVRIYGIHNEDTSEVPTFALPWATVAIPTTEAGIDGIGVNPGLLRGSQVIGIFADGEQSQYPIVLATIPYIQSETPIVSPSPDQISDITDMTGAMGDNNTERAFNFFASYQGGGYFSPEAAAGIVGNLIQESGVQPDTISEFTGESSFGIAQWNPAVGRLQALQSFASYRGADYTTIDTQLAFIVHELQLTTMFGLSELRSARSIEQATTIFCNRYERPDPQHARLSDRIRYARDVYSLYYLNNEGN